MNRIRKGDQVVVTTGNKKIKGQTGEVVRVDGERVYVANLNLIKRHTKPNPQAGQPGGVVEREASIHRDAAQPGDGQGRTRCHQGAREWKAHPRVPLQRRGYLT